jgi:DNA-binding transcriptional ArsR family regulator
MPPRSKQSKSPAPVDTGVVKAIGHPLRVRLLTRLNETIASPVELAREMDESVQLVSYHVRILRDLGFVELVSTTPRRGAIEHHYRAVRRPMFSDADWAALPTNARSALAAESVQSIFQHAAAALESGDFDGRTDTHVSFADLVLDEDGWLELNAKIGEVTALATELQSQAAGRIEDGAEEIRSRIAMLHYPATPGSADRSAASTRRGRKPKQRSRKAQG